MHPSPVFRLDEAVALAEAAAIGFAHLFVQTPAGPRVAHVPLLFAGPVARFHLANANALTPHLEGATALASLSGPNGYVSPNWYADARPRVPTWNYLAIELEGPVRRLGDAELVDLLDTSAAHHEQRVGENWTRAKLDPARFAALCAAITGFELRLETVRATAKHNQDKPSADRAAVAAALATRGLVGAPGA